MERLIALLEIVGSFGTVVSVTTSVTVFAFSVGVGFVATTLSFVNKSNPPAANTTPTATRSTIAKITILPAKVIFFVFNLISPLIVM
ncbi:hypothetical protein D3C86_1446010 [compost metagenome]